MKSNHECQWDYITRCVAGSNPAGVSNHLVAQSGRASETSRKSLVVVCFDLRFKI